jgi:hypothetical protein
MFIYPYTELVILALVGTLLSETETIYRKHRKTWFPNWEWWNARSKVYDNKIVHWLMLYPLSFLRDGFHFTKSLAIVLLLIAIFQTDIVNIVIGYTTMGIFFNLFYDK